MAAAYQTGTATSPTNLLQILVTWLVAQGWTSNKSQADGTGWRAHLSKGANYINLRATPGSETIWAAGIAHATSGQIGIGLYLGTGYSGAAAWNTQAGGPIGSGQTWTLGNFMQLPSGSIAAYHFFDDGNDNIVVVVERTSGIFTHMGWGPSITKAGAFTGGAYFFGALGCYGSGTTGGAGSSAATADAPFAFGGVSQSATFFVRADVDTFTGKWLFASTTANAAIGSTGKIVASGVPSTGGTVQSEIPQYTSFIGRITSALNTQANLLPSRLFAQRDTAGYSLIGDGPNIFFTNATANGYVPGSIYPLGSENYMIFPNFAVLKKA